MSIVLKSRVQVYNRYAITKKFTAQETKIEAVQGKISLLVSESEITELKNGNKTMYSRLVTTELNLNSITMAVSSSKYKTINGVLSAVTQAEASITLHSNQIALKVSKDSVISSINQTPESVKISANKIALTGNGIINIINTGTTTINAAKINLNGVVTANENFKILADGSMMAKNGVFNGRVDLTTGTESIPSLTLNDTKYGGYLYMYGNVIGISRGGSYTDISHLGFSVRDASNSAYLNSDSLRVDDIYTSGIHGQGTGGITVGGQVEFINSITVKYGITANNGITANGYSSNIHGALFSSNSILCRNQSLDCSISISTTIVRPSISLMGGGTLTSISSQSIVTPSLVQTSLKESKKNIQEFNNYGIAIVNRCTVYSYNLKADRNLDVIGKRTGFVIGDGFSVDDTIVNREAGGIELYSAIAVAYKAIQELSRENENLKFELINSLGRIDILERSISQAR